MNEDTVSMVSTLGLSVGVSYESSLMGFLYCILCLLYNCFPSLLIIIDLNIDLRSPG